MQNALATPKPEEYGLTNFADLLPRREPMLGEAAGIFDAFHDALIGSLAPHTPYECVITEHLIAIEWELLQQRRMRESSIREGIKSAIVRAVESMREAEYAAQLEADCDACVAAGQDEEDWEDRSFDKDAARQEGMNLATRAVDRDPEVQNAASMEVAALGMDLLDVMAQAYRGHSNRSEFHEDKACELERRRREVKRDLDALQKARPFDGEIAAE